MMGYIAAHDTKNALELFNRLYNVLLVLSDCHYDAGEYIRDYDEFLAICRKKETS